MSNPLGAKGVWQDHIHLCRWGEECQLPLDCSDCSRLLNLADLGLDHHLFAGLAWPYPKLSVWERGQGAQLFRFRGVVP